jgi:hypothetical protein
MNIKTSWYEIYMNAIKQGPQLQEKHVITQPLKMVHTLHE